MIQVSSHQQSSPRTAARVRRGLTVVGCAAVLAAPVVIAQPSSAAPGPPSTQVFVGAAADAGGLQRDVATYRAALGDPDNAANPPSRSGRREINWDGVPDRRAAPNRLPPAFFNTAAPNGSPRGAVFSTRNNRFQVSANANNPTNTAVRFGNLNPQYPQIFSTFSQQRLFTALDSNQLVVQFFVPGTNRRATVNGFGAVFTDVDRRGSTQLEYFDRRGRLLFRLPVPPGPTAQRSLSFAGVKRRTADIHSVRIISGNVVLSAANPDGGRRDAVAMDDFIYGEPRQVR